MRLRDVDLNLLVLFEALHQTRSVTRAAERLGLTQSGASRALGRLRQTFDDPLFVVVAGGLEPTPRGVILRDPLRACLRSAREMLTPDGFEPEHATGALRLGMPDHLAYLHGPALLSALASEAPGVDLVVRSFSRDWLRDLQEGEVDLTFGVLRGDEAQLRVRAGVTERWRVLLRRGHPALKRKWTAEAFARGRHGVMTVTGSGPSQIDRGLSRLGLSRRVCYRATSPLVAALAVVDSDLLVTTTEGLAHALARHHPLAIKPLPLDAEPLRLPLVWTERMHGDARHRWSRRLVAGVIGASRS